MFNKLNFEQFEVGVWGTEIRLFVDEFISIRHFELKFEYKRGFKTIV
jgi:hypothetical protein